MDAAETYAVEHGCFAATLDTHSYQALGFYQKRGYEVFGTLEDCPPGHTQIFPPQAAGVIRLAARRSFGHSPGIRNN